MKILLLGVVMLLLLCSFAFQKESKERNVQVTLHLDEYVNGEEQWGYLHSRCTWVSGSEEMIWDSVKIEKGQKEVVLHGYAPVEESFYVFFSRRGPEKLIFLVSPNDQVAIDVSKSDGEERVLKRIKGSDVNDLSIDFREMQMKLVDKQEVMASIGKKDSVDYYNNMVTRNFVNSVVQTKHPGIAYGSLLQLRTFYAKFLGEDSVQIMKEYASRKFPDYPAFMLDQSRIKSEQSVACSNRLKQLSMIRERETKLSNSLSIGGQLSLTLPLENENSFSISDIKDKRYILVDFWASWCQPCRAETPFIQKAISKHNNMFTVYAISIDTNREAWLRAIEKDGTKNFVHVYGVDENKQRMDCVKKMNITRIPTNFLLDNNYRIVAKDLRGTALMSTLDSLLNK